MPASRGSDQAAPSLVMHLTVPAEGGLRSIASELAARIAEHLGAAPPRAETIGTLVDRLASRLGNGGGPADRVITFAFSEVNGELVVAGRCEDQASEVRQQLGA